MPPPPLSTTTNVQGTSGTLTSPETSCRNARSPSRASVRGAVPEAATPSAVETTPSIPLAPRLASTTGGAGSGRGVPLEVADGHGGRDDHRGADHGGMAVHGPGHLRLVQLGAEHLGRWPAAPRSSMERQAGEPVRVGGSRRLPRSPPPATRPGPRAWKSVATRNGSGQCRHGSITTILAPAAAASTTYSPSALESHGAPRRTMVSGRAGCVRTMASAAPMVPVDAAARQRVGEDGPAAALARRRPAGSDRRARTTGPRR